jgi:rubrerythrin
MPVLKGSKTAENLMKAYVGESQARNRYTFYASQATKDGFVQISNIFLETAGNEKEHAEMFFKYLNLEFKGQEVGVNATYPIGLSDTLDELNYAADGEKAEHSVLYPEFAKVAKEEGFNDISQTFEQITKVEGRHEARFRALIDNIKNNKVFKKDTPVLWKCINCGFIVEGLEAPKVCPACKHPQAYFQVFNPEY